MLKVLIFPTGEVPGSSQSQTRPGKGSSPSLANKSHFSGSFHSYRNHLPNTETYSSKGGCVYVFVPSPLEWPCLLGPLLPDHRLQVELHSARSSPVVLEQLGTAVLSWL